MYAQRIDFNSNRQWSDFGWVIQIGSDQRFPRVISDGNQGIGVIWANYSYDGQGFNYSLRIDCLDHQGANNLINWKTANEINTSGFTVERSENGSRFYKTATVKSKNTISAN